MDSIKTIVAGLAVVVVAFGIAACGEAEGEPMTAPPAVNGEIGTAAANAQRCWTADQRIEAKTGGDGMPGKQYSVAPAMTLDADKRYTATLATNKGAIEIEFFPEDAPETVNNFICLARDGYFDGTPFHRVVKGFVIQGGDPTGTGSGGPGYRFNDEPVSREYEKGILAMANAGPNTNGSQFFVVLDDLRATLPKNYTIFGRVTDGQEAADAIAAVPTRRGASGEQSEPTEPVTLEQVTIHER